MRKRSLLAAPAHVALLGLLLVAPACARANGTPPTAPTKSTATTPSAQATPRDPTPQAPEPAAPASAAPVPVAQAPEPAAPATPAAATPAAAPPTQAAPPAGPLTVSIADELPFLATGATRHETKTTHARPKKLPPGTTGQRSTHHGRKRGGRPYHPDPGIIVDVTPASGQTGTVDVADVQRLARSHGYNPFRHCYEEGLRRNQRIGGKVSLEIVLASDGSVASAKKTASTVGDASVDQCVVREASQLALARPDGAAAGVAMVVTLSPGDEPVPVPHAAPHADKLRDALRARWSGVEVCYQKGLERRRDLGGRVEVRFKVKPSGEILEVGEGDTHFADGDVSKCMVGVFKGAKLPKVGKHETTFVYAIHVEAIPQATPTHATAP